MGALPPFIYLVLALGSFAIAAGLLVWVVDYIRGRGREGSKARERPPTGAAPTAESPAPAGEQELLRVSRTEKGGLAVFVRGQRYRHLQEIADAQMGRETIEALKAVLAFAEGWLPSLRQAPPRAAPRESTADEQTSLQRLRWSDLLSRGSPSEPSQPEPVIPVEKIDDLVQERLRERPDMAGRHVRLAAGAGLGLRIYVDRRTFEAVDDIPDPEVRALIQDAIREWEDSERKPWGT